MSKLENIVPVNGKGSKQYLLVNIGNNCWGIDIQYVKNVIRIPDITRVPKSQTYFKGIINLRGEIIAVMSLRSKMSVLKMQNDCKEFLGKLEDDLFTDDSRIVILNIRDFGNIGMIVDKVNGMVVLAEKDIDFSRKAAGDFTEKYVMGVGNYKDVSVFLMNVREAACRSE